MAAVADCTRLLRAVGSFGAKAPKSLTGLLDARELLTTVGPPNSDPADDLLADLAAGEVRGAELDRRIAEAAAAQTAAEYRRYLRERLEPRVVANFEKALKAGAADEIIRALEPKFDAAAETLMVAAAVGISPTVDVEAFLTTADNAAREAWAGLQAADDMVTKIGRVVSEFGPKSSTFAQIGLFNQSGLNLGAIDDRAVMCVDHAKIPLERACALFGRPDGPHRKSAWFQLGPALRLNSVAEAAESMRQLAEDSWEAMNGQVNRGSGYIDEHNQFVATPIPNPYRRKEAAS